LKERDGDECEEQTVLTKPDDMQAANADVKRELILYKSYSECISVDRLV
jgi:hypothetical protein